MSIELLPELPQEIIEAYETDQLVLFVGAGISRLTGCKSWHDMAYDLVNNVFLPAQANQISNGNYSDKELISMAYEEAKGHHKEDQYWACFEKAIKSGTENEQVYSDIAALETIIVTTNCDNALDRFVGRSNQTTACTSDRLNEVTVPFVFYLHGKYGEGTEADKKTLVFTSVSYINAYNDPVKIAFLQNLFRNKTVLFLGYGLSEFEVLDFLLQKGGKYINRHFILTGYYTYETPLQQAREQYYNSIGITQISYSKDVNNYKQQIEIIHDWVKQLKDKSILKIKTIQELESVITLFDAEHCNSLKRILLSEETGQAGYWNAFYQAVEQSENALNWLLYIWNENIATAQDMPAEGNDGWIYLWSLNQVLAKETVITDENYNDLLYIMQSLWEQYNMCYPSPLVNYHLHKQLTNLFLFLKPGDLNCEFLHFILSYLEIYYEDAVETLWSHATDIAKWEQKTIQILLKTLFSTYTEDSINSGYSLNLFNTRFLEVSPENAGIVADCAYEEFNKSRKEDEYYYSIEERLDRQNYNLTRALLETLQICMEKLHIQGTSLEHISGFASKAASSAGIQIVFFLAAGYNAGSEFLDQFIVNPLCYKNTWSDFYSYLQTCNEKGVIFSQPVLDKIITWIEEGDFGRAPDTDDQEINSKIEARNNGYRVLLLEELSKEYDESKEIYKHYLHTEFYPVSDKKRFVRSIDIPNINTVITGDDFRDLSIEQAFDVINEGVDNPNHKYWPYTREEVYYRFIIILDTQKRLEEALAVAPDRTFAELSAFSVGLRDWLRDKSNISIDLWPFTKSLYSCILQQEPDHDRKEAVASFVRLLWRYVKKVDFLEFSLNLDVDALFKEQDTFTLPEVYTLLPVYDEEDFYITLIIHFWNLQHIQDVHLQAEQYFEERLKGKRPFINLACSHQLKLLYEIDKDWCNSHLREILLSYPEYAPCFVVMAFNSVDGYYPEFTEIIFLPIVLSKLFSDLPEGIYVDGLYARLLRYLCDGYAIGQISWPQFQELMDNMQPAFYQMFFKCIQVGKTENVIEAPADTYYKAYKYTKEKERKAELANALMETVLEWDVLTDDIWELFIWAVENANHFYWSRFERIIRKHIPSNYKKAIEATAAAINKQSRPVYDYLESVLKYIKQYDLEACKKLARLCVDKGWYQIQLSELVAAINKSSDDTRDAIAEALNDNSDITQ